MQFGAGYFLTIAVNFINVKRTNFSYERHVLAAFSTYMFVEKRRSYEKCVRKMLMKLTLARIIKHYLFISIFFL